MKISTAEYFITESLHSIRRNGLMSMASLMTVALSLLILGIFTIMVLNLNNMASVLESQVQVTVYLQDSLKEAEIREVGTRITKLPGVTRVNFIDKKGTATRQFNFPRHLYIPGSFFSKQFLRQQFGGRIAATNRDQRSGSMGSRLVYTVRQPLFPGSRLAQNQQMIQMTGATGRLVLHGRETGRLAHETGQTVPGLVLRSIGQ